MWLCLRRRRPITVVLVIVVGRAEGCETPPTSGFPRHFGVMCMETLGGGPRTPYRRRGGELGDSLDSMVVYVVIIYA